MNGYVTKEGKKPETMNRDASSGKSDHDLQVAFAHSLGRRLVKGMIMKQAKRPLDSIALQLQMINGRLHRVTRRG